MPQALSDSSLPSSGSSPSLTSSIDSTASSSIPSPTNSKPGVNLQEIKFKFEFPPDHSCIRQPRMSAVDTPPHPRQLSYSSVSSPPSSPPSRHPNKQDPTLESHFSNAQKQQYRPYTPRSGYILPRLLHAARLFGVMSPGDLMTDQVEEDKDAFVEALSAMPDRVLLLVLRLKRADYDRRALRLALTTAEIRFTEQQQLFLSTMHEQISGHLTIADASLNVLDQVLKIRSLSEPESNQEYHRKARVDELVALTLVESHMSQLEDITRPHGTRWLGDNYGVEKVVSEGDTEEEDDGDSDDENSRHGS